MLLAAFAAFQIIACNNKEENNSKSTAVKPDSTSETDLNNIVTLSATQYRSIAIKTGQAQLRNLSAALKVNGRLEVPPQNAASITMPYGGIVKSTTLLEGKRVSRGERLVTLESPEFIQLQQDYLDGKSRLEFLTTEYSRQQELSAQNINAKKTLQKAKADYQAALNTVKGLKAKLSLIHINTQDLERTGIQNTVSVYSPINGYVTQVNVNRGTYVNPNNEMFRIVNKDNIYVSLAVFEKDIAKLRPGQKIQFSLANDSTAYKAKIDLIGKEIGKDGSIPVICDITGSLSSTMIPGIYIKASIEAGSSEVTALPESAIVSFAGKNYIFLPQTSKRGSNQENHSFQMMEVKTGVTEDGYIAVIFPRDFKAGSEIVTEGAYDLLSKMKNTEEEEE